EVEMLPFQTQNFARPRAERERQLPAGMGARVHEHCADGILLGTSEGLAFHSRLRLRRSYHVLRDVLRYVAALFRERQRRTDDRVKLIDSRLRQFPGRKIPVTVLKLL